VFGGGGEAGGGGGGGEYGGAVRVCRRVAERLQQYRDQDVLRVVMLGKGSRDFSGRWFFEAICTSGRKLRVAIT